MKCREKEELSHDEFDFNWAAIFRLAVGKRTNKRGMEVVEGGDWEGGEEGVEEGER